MDFDSSSKFIGSLAKFLQSLCNGYVEFDKGVEVIGHIYLSVDSDTGKKIDYVLNEKVCKNDNSVTFISNSFHAQPAEKPKPPPKKSDSDKRNEDSVVMDESGQAVPSSTNVGTMGPMRIHGSQDGSFSPGSKRPRSPLHRKGSVGRGPNSPAPRTSISIRYDMGGPAKIGRSDIPYATSNNMNSSEDYDGGGAFQDSEDGYSNNFLTQDDQSSSQDIDQKPIIDPDISIVKEEHMAIQQANTHIPSAYGQPSGPGRGKPSQSPYSMHQSPSISLGSRPPDTYTGSSLEGADPSTPLPWVSVSQDYAVNFQSQKAGVLRRRRFAESNEMYTSTQRDEIGRYALLHGAAAASRHYSDVLGKRIPRSSVQNFINALRRSQAWKNPP